MRNTEKRSNVTKLRGVGTRVVWDPAPTRLFLKLWLDYIEQIKGTGRNAYIHKEIAKKMGKYEVNHIEIKAKMDNMTKKYKNEMIKFRKTGLRSKWAYLDEMQEILKDSQLVNLSLYMDEDFDYSPMEDSDSGNDLVNSKNKCFESRNMTEAEIKTEFKSVENDSDCSTYSDEETLAHNESDRILAMEKAKMEIEKKKLKTLKRISDQLSAVHRDILKVFKNNL